MRRSLVVSGLAVAGLVSVALLSISPRAWAACSDRSVHDAAVAVASGQMEQDLDDHHSDMSSRGIWSSGIHYGGDREIAERYGWIWDDTNCTFYRPAPPTTSTTVRPTTTTPQRTTSTDSTATTSAAPETTTSTPPARTSTTAEVPTTTVEVTTTTNAAGTVVPTTTDTSGLTADGDAGEEIPTPNDADSGPGGLTWFVLGIVGTLIVVGGAWFVLGPSTETD